jgi:hypothetical protein
MRERLEKGIDKSNPASPGTFTLEMIDQIEAAYKNSARLLEAYYDEFAKNFLTVPTEESGYNAGAWESVSWALLDTPVLLYSFGLNGSAIIELCSILEWFGAAEIAKFYKLKGSTMQRVTHFMNLPDVAEALKEIGAWNEKDVRFATKLNRLRNGVAHKNAELVSKAVLARKKISMLDIDTELKNVNILPYINESTRLLIKMMEFSAGVSTANPTPKAQADTPANSATASAPS